jgi:hypothetical protein
VEGFTALGDAFRLSAMIYEELAEGGVELG